MLWEHIKEVIVVSLTFLIMWATITTGSYLRKQYLKSLNTNIVLELIMFILLVPLSVVMLAVSIKLSLGWLQ